MTKADEFQKAHPHVEALLTGVVDLNGQWRGKRMPIAALDKVLGDGFRMPLSLMGVDIWGRDAEGSKLVFESGDGDGVVRATDRGPLLGQSGGEDIALVPASMWLEDGTPFLADPRQALRAVEAEVNEAGYRIVTAVELEFYLTDPGGIYPTAQPSGRLSTEYDMVSFDELDRYQPFLKRLYATCAAQNIPADAAISENGPGQFEVNLHHVEGAVQAADDAVLFKRAVKTAAAAEGLAATFMAKPFGERSGSGLHVHFSLLDAAGENVFSKAPTILDGALHGLLNRMPAHMALFAPHQNSYRRFAAHSHAPCHAAWGEENRTAALRLPGGGPKARRIEHRVSGADANPYLVLAAILGAALEGIQAGGTPPPPIEGDVYASNAQPLPRDWQMALTEFADADHGGIFAEVLVETYLAAKRQEIARFEADISAFEYRTYLDHA